MVYADAMDLRVRDFPVDLNRRLKAIAGLDGISLSKKVVDLLWEGVKRDKRIVLKK